MNSTKPRTVLTTRPITALLSILISLWALLVPRLGYGEALRCELLPQIFSLYLRNHYSHKNLSDELKRRTVDEFVKNMDPSKTSLLKSDVDKLKTDVLTTFSTMKTGNCEKLGAATELLQKRAEENQQFVKSFLNEQYALDKTTVWASDPKKRDYPKTQEEKQELLKKLVHFQISGYLLTDESLPEAKKGLVHRYELVTKRLKNRKPQEDLEFFLEAFAEALDPHSSFLSRDSLEEFQISMELSLEGIGASLRSQDGFTVIESLIKGGAADKSKLLKSKDKIIAVAQGAAKPVSVIDMELRDVVKLIRGKKGTPVRLTVIRQKEKSETIEVEILRDKIDIQEQAAKITYQDRTLGKDKFKVGILELPSFYGAGKKGARSSSEDVKKLLVQAKKNGVDAIVLDLSSNGGGLLNEAVNISGLFLYQGGIAATKNSAAQIEVLKDEDSGIVYAGPLVVLVSRLSASASEILAGSLKDYKRGLITGADHTFGKGSVQAVVNLPLGLGGMKVTTGLFFIPGGKSTQLVGVGSDVVLPSVLSSEDIGEEHLDYALPAQSIDEFVHAAANSKDAAKPSWTPIDSSITSKLSDLSATRVAKEPKFAEIKKRIEESKKNAGVIKLSDSWSKADEKKTKKAKKVAGKKKRTPLEEDDENDDPKPIVDEAVNVAVDLVQAIRAKNPQEKTTVSN